jgi:hypothetical protein
LVGLSTGVVHLSIFSLEKQVEQGKKNCRIAMGIYKILVVGYFMTYIIKILSRKGKKSKSI